MSKLTLTEAVKVIPVSESTLRRDLKSGKVSCEIDEKGRKRLDAAELTRVYGELKDAEPSAEPHQNPSMNGNDSKVIALLEGQVQDLKARLASAETEKQLLLELANRLQQQNEVLMLPADTAPEKSEKSPGWFSRLKSKLSAAN